MVTVEYIKESDADELYELFGEWDRTRVFDYDIFMESFNYIVKDGKGLIIAAKREGVIIGYAQMFRCYELGFVPFYEIADFLVTESERNKGIGKLLMKRIEEISMQDGFKEVRLSSQVHRTFAHAFYENLGFEYFKISKFYRKRV